MVVWPMLFALDGITVDGVKFSLSYQPVIADPWHFVLGIFAGMDDYWHLVLVTMRMAVLVPNLGAVDLPLWSSFLQLLLRIIAPVLAFLLALAVRKRFRFGQ